MAAVLEYITTDEQINGADHTGVDIGDAHPDRNLLIMVVSRGGGSLGPQAMTVGGQQARRIGRSNVNSVHMQCSAWWVDNIPFGRTADIVINGATGATDYAMVAVYRCVNGEIYDVVSDVDTSTAATGGTISIGGDSDYSAVGVCLGHVNTDTIAWSGLTERVEDTIDESHQNDIYGVADLLDASEQELAVTATYDSSQSHIQSIIVSVRSANAAREIVVESTESGTSFVCPKGTNLLAVVVAGGASEVDITYDTNSLTRIAQGVAGSASFAEVWILRNPPINSSGLLNSTGGFEEHYAICLSGVDLKSVIEVAENSSTSTALTSFETQLGSLSDEVFLLDAFRLDSQVTPSAGTGQTAIETGSTADPEGWGFSYKTVDSAAFDSMSWTFASADEPAHAVAAFQPQRLKTPAYQYEEVEGTLVRMDFNYGFNDQGPYRSRWTKDSDPTFASGVATFDGVDDYLDGPAFDFVGNGIFTFSLWARTTTISGDDCYFSVHGNLNNNYAMLTNSGGKVSVVFRNSTSNGATSTSFVNDGDWHHIVGMGDGSTVKIFVDGVLENTTTITVSAFTPTGSRIGSRTSFNPEYYPGDMADVRIFNRPLTNAEVADLYARGINNLPVRRKWDSDPDLVLDIDGRHQAGTDRSGKENHATLNNDTFYEVDGSTSHDGATDYLSCENAVLPVDAATDPLTLCCWIKTSTATGDIFGNYTGGGAGRWVLQTSGGALNAWNATDGNFLTATTTHNDGDWHFVSLVKSGNGTGEAEIFLDAESEDTGDWTVAVLDEPLQIGYNTAAFNGNILRPMVWHRALTNAEIKEIYKLTDPRLNLNADPPQRRQLHGCVGHWTAATEGRDLSGNGNHATYINDFATNGGLMEFVDGSTDSYLEIADSDSLSLLEGSVFAWVYLNSTSNEAISTKLNGTGTANILWQLRVLSGEILAAVYGTSSTVITTSGAGITTGTWYHIGITWDADNLKVYLDGDEIDTASVAGTITDKAANVYIGSWGPYSAAAQMDGLQDDHQLYNRALTNAEVKWLYQSGTPYRDAPEQRALPGLICKLDAAEEAIDTTAITAGYSYEGGVTSDGTAWTFDGTDDYLDGPVFPSVGEGIFTYSFWMNSSTMAGDHCMLSVNGNSHTRYANVQNGGGRVRFSFRNSSIDGMTGTISVNDGDWHHIAVTGNGSTFELYVDGTSDGTASKTVSDFTVTGSRVGSRNSVSPEYYPGDIKDVRIYNRALSAEEVSLLYNGGTSGYVPSVNHLEAPYQAGGRWCPTITGDATDATDNGNNGTLTNGATTTIDYEDHGEAAFSTDGVNDYIALSDIEAMDAVSEATWSVHFNPDAWGNNDFVIEKGSVFLLGKHSIITPNEGGFAIDDGSWQAINFSSAPTLGEWLPAVATFDNGTLELFASGTSQGTLTGIGSINNTTSAFNIAGRGTTFPFNGLSDDVMFLPRASHQAEINWISSERGIKRPLDPYNPVAWWCPSLDFPNAGTDYLMDLARDAHGDLSGGMTAASSWVIDTERGGVRPLYFDGAGDYVDGITLAEMFSSTGGFTLAVWVKSTDHDDSPLCYVFGSVDSSASTVEELGLWYSGSNGPYGGSIGIFNERTGDVARTATTLIGTDQENVWHHVVVTYDGGTEVNFYFDGEQVETALNAWDATTAPAFDTIVLGSRGDGDPNDFEGYADDWRLYDKVLPIEAIKNLASKRGWTPEETTTITTASDAAPLSTFPFWILED